MPDTLDPTPKAVDPEHIPASAVERPLTWIRVLMPSDGARMKLPTTSPDAPASR